MIEDHADDLTRSVVGDLQENPKTPTYGKLSTEDLYQRVREVFRDFGQWLEYKPDETMERWCYLANWGRSDTRKGFIWLRSFMPSR